MAGGFGFITITIGGAQQFDLRVRQFQSWGHAIQDLTPAWTEIGEDLLGDFAQNMIREGGFYGGKPWQPLKPATIAEKQRLGFGYTNIMQRTGVLFESLTSRGAAGNIFEARANSLTVGTSIFYAHFHQQGGPVIPQRLLVGINKARREGIVKRLDDFIREQARRAGLSTRGD